MVVLFLLLTNKYIVSLHEQHDSLSDPCASHLSALLMLSLQTDSVFLLIQVPRIVITLALNRAAINMLHSHRETRLYCLLMTQQQLDEKGYLRLRHFDSVLLSVSTNKSSVCPS